MVGKPALPKTLLIDGDHVLHRACVAVEKEARFDDETHYLTSEFSEAWHNVESALNTLMYRHDTDKLIICLSYPTGGPYFRHAILPTYKSKRADSRKPLCFTRCREELEGLHRTIKFDGLEADDVMGILGSRNPDTTIICSADKDMKTIPCTLDRDGKTTRISEAEADYWHMMQTLTGDTTDCYAGCPGMGPVKAAKLLKVEDGDGGVPMPIALAWPVVVGAFKKAGLTEADALVQARVARILRDTDWHREKKEVKLWEPPSSAT